MNIILCSLLIVVSINCGERFKLYLEHEKLNLKHKTNPDSPIPEELKVNFVRAIYNDDVNQVKSYLQQAPQLAQQTIKREYGSDEFPMLGHALVRSRETAGNNNFKIIEALLNAGANPNQIMRNNSPLTLYLSNRVGPQKGMYQVVKALLDKGANPNFETYLGFTPLMYASKNDDGSVVQLLLNRGAEINRVNRDGETALIIAAKSANSDIVRRLLAVPTATDIRKKERGASYFSMLPAEIAQKVDTYNIIDPKIIADPNIKTKNGWTALDYAENYLATWRNRPENLLNDVQKQIKRNLQEIINLLRPITQKKTLIPVTRPAPAKPKQ